MVGLVALVIQALWAMLPAYVPNNAAVLGGGGLPIDGGRTLHGKRLLGDGKTWRGTAAGTLAGLLVAIALNVVRPVVAPALGVDLPHFPLHAAFTLAFGAMLGDISASFVKRRIGRQRGSAVPGLDQLDFVIVSLVSTAIVAPHWFAQAFTPSVLVVVVVMTPALHVGTNVIAYVLGLKNEPW